MNSSKQSKQELLAHKTPTKNSHKASPSINNKHSKALDPGSPQHMPQNTSPFIDSDQFYYPNMPDVTQLNEYQEGESIRVALRIRPMNSAEIRRGDENCARVINDSTVQIINKASPKHFGFNMSFAERINQQEVFQKCGVPQLLDSVLDGYSATVLAYGQTGSGKTYTMAGVEEKLGQEIYISDETEGLIPRGFRYLWQSMVKRQEQFYVKASYMEIYNEQLRDLLNPSSGILHTRWNVKNGFFVEDLLVVECASVDDLVAVLHEGMKNRKKGSHELNQDSSRSHSILTVYVISEVITQGQALRKYGKISFVDLAGSERLKESKSNGEMVKETGNINKSLFTLGKVISGLSDKKNKTPYIPYRDSKLTMLLMDSIGGTAKALMIACINPSAVYLDETLSTLSYATRTMNIKNKPILQVDPKAQIVLDLTRENELLKAENQYLREQLQRASKGLPIEMPDFSSPQKKSSKFLPPLSGDKKKPSSSKKLGNSINSISSEVRTDSRDYQLELPVNKLMTEYNYQINQLKSENEELRQARDLAEKNYHILMNDNNALNIKLENLENVFIGNPVTKGDAQSKSRTKAEDDFMISNLMSENTELKKRIRDYEEKNLELKVIIKEKGLSRDLIKAPSQTTVSEVVQLKESNGKLQERIEYLQQRERELMNSIHKFQKPNGLF